ncbi:TIGR03668 family PPOX class F420-dependent oxidoreductase [Halalkalicoccus tibetensis]|uniref:TIGR03668 family PPOX class F420-dependent oxidoreductase n=1 Tax=Halalkalicoccus tibetensis TaxID=175632 RepID=A0ABD5V6C2_9EURY
MVLSDRERAYVERARVARLATADDRGRPQVVPVCFALVDGAVVSAVDEKPAEAGEQLRRVRDVESNPFVSLVVDHYREDWDRLGWVQLRGWATVLKPGADGREAAIGALRGKYEQYEDHALEERPLVWIEPGHAVSWGDLR